MRITSHFSLILAAVAAFAVPADAAVKQKSRLTVSFDLVATAEGPAEATATRRSR
jgi:hypothetical protein